jgi:hypothetical protein
VEISDHPHPEYMRPKTWMDDRRQPAWYKFRIDKKMWTVIATPTTPGQGGYTLKCRELPGWTGRAYYAYPDPRCNVEFQFFMQTRDLRADHRR